MRILFATDAVDHVSTVLNSPNFAQLNECEGVSIDFYNHNYANYDVVLFMGYDPRVEEARAANPSIKIGVIDLRPSSLEASLGADFVIANGLEMYDWLADYFANIFIYPIYPHLEVPPKIHTEHSPLIIGYHGNKVHLMAAFPYLSTALEALGEECDLELWAIYDIKRLGPLPFDVFDETKIKIRYIQWADDVYVRNLSQADIGIVPNLVPVREPLFAKKMISSLSNPFQPHESDVLLRYKSTTNPGRIYVFSQLGIPVVTGCTPSGAQVIRHGVNGYIARSAGGWYWALKKLVESVELRSKMGRSLFEDFQAEASPQILNYKLVEFIGNLKPTPRFPSSRLANAEKKLSKLSNSKPIWVNWVRSYRDLLQSKDEI